MPRKKRKAFGKKAALKRAAVTVDSTFYFPQNTVDNSRSSSKHIQKWSIESGMIDPLLPGTSMQQLALNTRNKLSHWDQNTSLRGRPVTFISGGFVEPLEEPETSESIVSSKVSASRPPFETDRLTSSTTLQDQMKSEFSAETQPAFHSADTDSSDEEILFKGRGAFLDTHPSAKAAVEQPLKSSNTVDSPIASPPSHSHGLDLLIADTDDEAGSDAAINDYIQNLGFEEMEDFVRQFATNQRELGGAHGDIVVDITSSDTEIHGDRSVDIGDNDDDDDDSDDNDVHDNANSDEVSTPRELRKLLQAPKRHRQSHSTSRQTAHYSGSDDSDKDIDDKHLARLLAKQEELGMGGDDLILFDTKSSHRAAGNDRRPDKQQRWRRRQPWQTAYDFTRAYRASKGSYPSAEAVADAFEQLEVSGWTGNRSEFQLQLSDSELEATLRASWQKDRMRKKEKKRAREELRSQGLLKKSAKSNDPRIKYPNGMSLDDMKTEFHAFLVGSENSVTLSPMDAHARKVVHEIAYRFNIASKSTGSGDQRRPTLVRKKSTLKFDNELFQNVFAKYQRRFFARLDGNKNSPGLHKKTLAQKGGGMGAATVRNGEVVGGSAPEIGVENKGRTMLEKMGWTTGMALGAVDNKGMTQIIEHVVKRSKAGLG